MIDFGRKLAVRGTIGILATLGIAGGIAVATQAQPSDNLTENTAIQLGLPAEFTVYGQRDQNIRRPTAIVNGEIITGTDVDHRMGLFMAANRDVEMSDDESNRIRMQIVRNLIDETLQIQEARANDITIGASDIQTAFARVAERASSTPEAFITYLGTQGTSARSIRRQIEGELAWGRLLRRYVNPYVGVSDAEVREVISRLESTRGQTEYRVAEIYLPAQPENQAEIQAGAERILEQIRAGGSFQAYARQFSQASTAAVGGDLGWIHPGQLPPELAAVVTQMPVNGVSQPIPIPGGFSIIALVDQRQVLVASPRDAMLSLKQITIAFPEGTEQSTAQPRVSRLAELSQAGGGCGAADSIAAEVGGEVVQNDDIRLGDLPAILQQTMLDLQVGQATPPFGSLAEGVRVLVLCGRDDPAQVAEPDAEAISGRIEQERADRRARRYLRDLRRDAVIEYR